ncbi:MAG: helix-turn-helix domain-containing protein [Lachnospiraceae bacterium]|nr:helix-turn-helix domain-containing protein [Lachnospiraceae bacterium]
MSRYKKVMLQRGVMQKEVSESVHKIDPRVDSPLLSKIINDVVLPTPRTLATICKTLACEPLDIYEPHEIALVPPTAAQDAAGGGNTDKPAPSAEAERKRQRRRDKGLYNLTVEIPRDIAERVFAPEALRKLGYLSKSDFVRYAVVKLDERLSTIEAKEKADGAGTPNGKNN